MSISASDRAGELSIEVGNNLHPAVDVHQRRELVAAAVQRYDHDSAMKTARSEGGSGLSKIWRILEFDFKVKHSMLLEVMDEVRFRAVVSFSSDGIRKC